jgi:hypothetical protein
MREVAPEFRAPVMLYSIGKDSSVMLHLARKAFFPGSPPFPVLHIDTAAAPDVPGVDFAILYESAWELVLLERWAPGTSVTVPVPGGIELFVLDGSFAEGGEEFTPLSWLRLPVGAMLQATAGRGGCRLWVKSGHLARGPRSPTAAWPAETRGDQM